MTNVLLGLKERKVPLFLTSPNQPSQESHRYRGNSDQPLIPSALSWASRPSGAPGPRADTAVVAGESTDGRRGGRPGRKVK